MQANRILLFVNLPPYPKTTSGQLPLEGPLVARSVCPSSGLQLPLMVLTQHLRRLAFLWCGSRFRPICTYLAGVADQKPATGCSHRKPNSMTVVSAFLARACVPGSAARLSSLEYVSWLLLAGQFGVLLRACWPRQNTHPAPTG